MVVVGVALEVFLVQVQRQEQFRERLDTDQPGPDVDDGVDSGRTKMGHAG